MLKENACNLLNLESFQIDVSFKRVQGVINEFEINRYDEDHKLSKCINLICYTTYIII
jgi:hypothetical protein